MSKNYMDLKLFIFIFYGIIAISLIIFNKYLAKIIYKLILILTNSLNVDDWFLFKIDDQNKNSLLNLARIFLLILGIMILFFIYILY